MKRQSLIIGLVLTAISLAGCTGGGGTGDEFVTPPMEDGAYVIKMTPDFKFIPKFAEVPAGATIVWVNDGGGHNVVPEGHSAWSGSQVSSESGEHLRVTINAPGDYPYSCVPHKSLGMIGTLRVV